MHTMAVLESTHRDQNIIVNVYRYSKDTEPGIDAEYGFVARDRVTGELAGAYFDGAFTEIVTRMIRGPYEALLFDLALEKPNGCICGVSYQRIIFARECVVHKVLVERALWTYEGVRYSDVVYLERNPATGEFGLLQVEPFAKFVKEKLNIDV